MTKKAHEKIKTFLKITEHKNAYHTLVSGFLKVPHYDVISFVPQECENFTVEGWEKLSSKELLNSVDALMANDLYKASLITYPELLETQPKGWYFSGSGSTYFKIK